MSEKSLTSHKKPSIISPLNKCPYCMQYLEWIKEDDVHEEYVAYTVRCKCEARTTYVTHEALVQGGEDYALDIAHQRWKEVVDRMHMAKENPGSKEETGVNSNEVWNAVIEAMAMSYYKGISYSGSLEHNITREHLGEMLKERLSEVRESSDLPSEDHQW